MESKHVASILPKNNVFVTDTLQLVLSTFYFAFLFVRIPNPNSNEEFTFRN